MKVADRQKFDRQKAEEKRSTCKVTIQLLEEILPHNQKSNSIINRLKKE